jgi:uncharacterized protein (UPF0261 family)
MKRPTVSELDLHINDPAFADAAANKLLELMGHVEMTHVKEG